MWKGKITHANTLAASKNLAPKVDYILPSADVVVVLSLETLVFLHTSERIAFWNHECFLKQTSSNHLHSGSQNKVQVRAGTLMRCPFFFSFPKQMQNYVWFTFQARSPLRARVAVATELLASLHQRCLPVQNLWQRTEMTALCLTPTLCLFRKVLEIVFHQPHSLSTHNYLA